MKLGLRLRSLKPFDAFSLQRIALVSGLAVTAASALTFSTATSSDPQFGLLAASPASVTVSVVARGQCCLALLRPHQTPSSSACLCLCAVLDCCY
jgi:hypothetical protein